MITMTEVIEQNRHAQLERKWLKEDMRLASIYANLFTAGVVIFIIATGVIRAKMLGF